jgi:hypothetical protein
VLDERPASCEREGRHLLALVVQADRAAEHVSTQFDESLVADVMPLVELAQQRLDPGPERPPRLQACWIRARRLHSAVAAGHRVLARLDDHRRKRWQLDHLAAPTSAAGLGQWLATPSTRARTTLHHRVRRAPHPTDADLPSIRSDSSASLPPGRFAPGCAARCCRPRRSDRHRAERVNSGASLFTTRTLCEEQHHSPLWIGSSTVRSEA